MTSHLDPEKLTGHTQSPPFDNRYDEFEQYKYAWTQVPPFLHSVKKQPTSEKLLSLEQFEQNLSILLKMNYQLDR